VKSLLKESKGVVHDELSEGLSPMKNIQPHIDLISEASLPNLSHYWINLKKLYEKDEDFKEI